MRKKMDYGWSEWTLKMVGFDVGHFMSTNTQALLSFVIHYV